MEIDLALLVLRIGVGLIVAAQGARKLFGWFRGPGLDGAGRFFENVGYQPGRPLAAVAGISEICGGILVAAGLFTPGGATIVLGTMLVAVSAHWSNGLWNSDRGYELPASYAVIAMAILLAGPGRFSVDRAVGLSFDLPLIAPAGILAAAGGAGLMVLRRGLTRRAERAAKP